MLAFLTRFLLKCSLLLHTVNSIFSLEFRIKMQYNQHIAITISAKMPEEKHMPISNTLPSRLRQLREQSNYTQTFVADQLHVSRQAVSRWENGSAAPDIDTLALLADLYHLSVDELIQHDCSPSYSSSDEIIPHQILKKNISVIETICLSVLLLATIGLPVVPVVLCIVVAIWTRKTKRDYIFLYLVCILTFLVGVHNSYVLISYIFSIGTPSVEEVDEVSIFLYHLVTGLPLTVQC